MLDDLVFTPWDTDKKSGLVEELRKAVRVSTNNPGGAVELRRAHWHQEFGNNHFEQMLAKIPDLRDVGSEEYLRNYFLAGSFLMLGGAERLNMLMPTERERPGAGYYVCLLSRLFYSDAKRGMLQKIIEEGFQSHFVIDPLGQQFEAKISGKALPAELERSLADEAVDFFRQAVEIGEMSDGVRAFCGMLAAVVASDAKMILIDEPEAFLHPALCVKLARELCRLSRENGQQLFIASHSASFLMGCVQAGIDLNIIRLTYRDGMATSRLLSQTELVPLLRQPLLRSIGALTGIFYESVVVTEADADRAFYDEINHRCLNFHNPSGIPDCLFLNAQNWQTTARIIAPLRRLGVAAAAIVDLDILLESKSDSFQALIEAAGMPPSSRTAIGQLRGQLHAILKPLRDELKRKGKECVTGNERLDLENFIDQLARYGVFLVPVGELECWLPSLARADWSGKNDWLLRTFEAMGEDASEDTYLKPTDGDVWAFFEQIHNWLQDPRRLGMPAE